MINVLPESEGATIGLEVSGKIDINEEEIWISAVNKLIEEHNEINILILLGGKIHYEIDAGYEDLKWMFKHLKNMNKLAIVSDSKVLGWLVKADSLFAKPMGISEEHFETSKLPEAWAWIKG